MNIRRTVLAACAVALSLTAAACSAPAHSTASGGVSGTIDKNTTDTITYGTWNDGPTTALDADIAAFNKIYPNIKVNLQQTPSSSFWTKLQTQAQSKTMPDVLWMNGPNFQLYASAGMLEPMTAAIKAGNVNLKNYPKSLDELYTYNGVTYGIPKDFDTVGVWYNKALFAKAGVPLPTADWTWDDFHAKAKEISDKLKPEGVYGVAADLTGGQTSYYNTILQNGGQIISSDGKKSGYDSPAAIKGLQQWADLVQDGSSPTVQQMSDTDPQRMFISGKAAMYWSGPWETDVLKPLSNASDINVINLPTGGKQATVIHGLSYVVSANSKHKAAAMAFATFLGSKQAEEIWGNTGTVIPAFNGTQESFYKSVPNFNLKIFGEEAADYSYPYPISKNTPAWNELETNLLPKAFSGQEPVATVAKDLAAQMNKDLAAE